MELKGKILNLSRGLNGGYTMVLEIAQIEPESIKNIMNDVLSITIKKWHRKRSRNANAYFHVLVGKIAEAVGCSVFYVKNDLLAECGYQTMLSEDEPAIIKTNIEPDIMMEQELLHSKVCKIDVEENGNVTYFYKIYRGSHTFDTKEMHRLIDLTIYRAKELGIETLTPEEIERMISQWEKQRALSQTK